MSSIDTKDSVASAESALKRLEKLSSLLDAKFTIPFLNIKFGLDSLIGLIPGIGDSATAVLSLYVLLEAFRYDLPAKTRAKMIGNVVLDVVVGMIPVLGDIFDVFFKANLRNTDLLAEHLRTQVRPDEPSTVESPSISKKNILWLFAVAFVIISLALVGLVQVVAVLAGS